MTRLARLQHQLQQAILGRIEMDWPGLEIYRDAYRLRLTEALEAEYPMLTRWLGQERFSRMAWDYIRAHPSRHRSIRWIGRHLAEFLHRRGEPAHGEMAAFEWALGLAFDSADAVPLSGETLAAVPPERWPDLRLEFHASVSLQRFHYPVPRLWKALQAETRLPDCVYQQEPQDWLIWRRELRCYFRSLSPAEARVLEWLLDGEIFSAACACLAGFDLPGDAARQMAGWLQRWLEDGLVVRIA